MQETHRVPGSAVGTGNAGDLPFKRVPLKAGRDANVHLIRTLGKTLYSRETHHTWNAQVEQIGAGERAVKRVKSPISFKFSEHIELPQIPTVKRGWCQNSL